MKNIILISLIYPFLLLGYNTKIMEDKIMNQQEIESIKKAIETRVTNYTNDMKTINVEKMLSFWANTEEFVAAPDGKMIIGFSDFATQQRKKLSELSSVDNVEIDNVHIYVLSKDAASFTFRFKWSMTKKSGDKIHSKGTWTYVFKLFNGEWKVVHSTGTHTNN